MPIGIQQEGSEVDFELKGVRLNMSSRSFVDWCYCTLPLQ